MFTSNPKKITLTLVVYLAFTFALLSATEAKGFATVHRRDHGSLTRFVKKRSPLPSADDLSPLQGLGSDPTGVSASTDATPSSSSAASSDASREPVSASSSSTSAPSSASSSLTPPTSTSPTSASSASSTSATSSSSSLSSSSSSSSSTSSSTSTSAATTSAPAATQPTSEAFSVTEASDNSDATSTKSKVTLTVSGSAAAASSSSSASVSGAASKTKTASLTALIVVASCVGGVAILWTIFRKWKLARSSKFDQRMQPIDWQPTTEDSGLPTHRRAMSDTSSFHSGLGPGNATSDLGHGSSDAGHGTGDMGPLPEHDFTAGPSHLAPVGGYADLARGPSPQPQMQETLMRGLSLTRPNYDVGVPLHHQTGYGSTGGY